MCKIKISSQNSTTFKQEMGLCSGLTLEFYEECPNEATIGVHCNTHDAIKRVYEELLDNHRAERRYRSSHRLIYNHYKTYSKYVLGFSDRVPWTTERPFLVEADRYQKCNARDLATGDCCENYRVDFEDGSNPQDIKYKFCRRCNEIRNIITSEYHLEDLETQLVTFDEQYKSYIEYFLRLEFYKIFQLPLDAGHKAHMIDLANKCIFLFMNEPLLYFELIQAISIR